MQRNNRRPLQLYYASCGYDASEKFDIRGCCRLIAAYNRSTRSRPFYFMRFESLNAMRSACKYGHSMCLFSIVHMWPSQILPLPFGEPICSMAAEYGQLACLDAAHQLGFQWDETTAMSVVNGGSRECFRYAHRYGCPVTENVCIAAVILDRLEIFRYALEAGCPVPRDVCTMAIALGRERILRYAYHMGYPVPRQVCYMAAKRGHLGVLQYAREIGAGWDCRTTAVAAMYGHLSCLQFAHRNHCPMNELTGDFAAVGGSLACLVYAVENWCPLSDKVCSYACDRGMAECFRYLQQLGYRMEPTTALSVCYGRLDCVRHLIEDGRPWFSYFSTMDGDDTVGLFLLLETAQQDFSPNWWALWDAVFLGRFRCTSFTIDGGSMWVGRGWIAMACRIDRGRVNFGENETEIVIVRRHVNSGENEEITVVLCRPANYSDE